MASTPSASKRASKRAENRTIIRNLGVQYFVRNAFVSQTQNKETGVGAGGMTMHCNSCRLPSKARERQQQGQETLFARAQIQGKKHHVGEL